MSYLDHGSQQSASLLAKTAAAADEFKRLLAAEKQWAEERHELGRKQSELEQNVSKQTARIKALEEMRSSEASLWRREKEDLLEAKEAALARIRVQSRALEAVEHAEVSHCTPMSMNWNIVSRTRALGVLERPPQASLVRGPNPPLEIASPPLPPLRAPSARVRTVPRMPPIAARARRTLSCTKRTHVLVTT